MNKKSRLLFTMFGTISILLITGCSIKKQEPSMVGEMAYDVHPADNFTVYIKENGQYAPYLVLSNDYNENTLLLRKEALDQECQFSEGNDNDNDYYATSYVDSYLNSEYYDMFSDTMKKTIVDSKIQITKNYPDIFDVEEIERKIFLLSCTEVNIDMDIANEEGEPLKYFAQNEHRLCQGKGAYVGWWLRSNYLPERSLVWCISAEGVIGGGGVQYPNGVRPAFCVPSTTAVEKEQISSNTEVYVLSIIE